MLALGFALRVWIYTQPRAEKFVWHKRQRASGSEKQSICRERVVSQANGTYEVELGFVLALLLVSAIGARANYIIGFEGRCPP